jgi:hypothetical protein
MASNTFFQGNEFLSDQPECGVALRPSTGKTPDDGQWNILYA